MSKVLPGMGVWNTGIMAVWKFGMMECWNNGISGTICINSKSEFLNSKQNPKIKSQFYKGTEEPKN